MVLAEAFLQHFSSDRSHMRTASGEWASPPPPYDCICGKGLPSLVAPYFTACEMPACSVPPESFFQNSLRSPRCVWQYVLSGESASACMGKENCWAMWAALLMETPLHV